MPRLAFLLRRAKLLRLGARKTSCLFSIKRHSRSWQDVCSGCAKRPINHYLSRIQAEYDDGCNTYCNQVPGAQLAAAVLYLMPDGCVHQCDAMILALPVNKQKSLMRFLVNHIVSMAHATSDVKRKI